MIYCVVPEELAPELYDKLAAYYEDDPNVEVIIDRRKTERRSADGEVAASPPQNGARRRQVRDRRRPRVPGEFPQLDPE